MQTNLAAKRIQNSHGVGHPKAHGVKETKARARRPLRQVAVDSAQRSGAPSSDGTPQRNGAPFSDGVQRSGAPFILEVANPATAWEGVPDLLENDSPVELDLPAGPPDEVTPTARDSGSLETATTLTTYFRDLSHYGILKPAEELRAVKGIEELEIQLWACILSHGPAVGTVLDLIASTPPPQGTETSPSSLQADLRALRRLAGPLFGPAQKAKQQRILRQAAERLRTLDADRRHADLAIEYLHGAEAGGDAPFKASGSAFAAYLHRVDGLNQAAAAARNAFIQANLRLVVAIARRYRRDLLSFSDLIQEGNIGLMKGLLRYDHRRGVKFSTYACWWIRHSINRALADKGRAVRLPVHLIDARSRIAKAEHVLDGQLGHQPSDEEISLETKISVEKIEKVRIYARDRSVSLDRPLAGEDDRDLLEIFQDPGSDQPSAAEVLGDIEMNQTVVQMMQAVLRPIELSILRWRFGFEEDRSFTLREIGDKYDLSRERIRQIEGQALAKLRAEMERLDMA